jgi:hypothetical protein
LAALDFACNQQARLLPITKGILYFAFSASVELFAYAGICHPTVALSEDPSTLGHSACKIGHNTPPNLKKVDYYPSAVLLYLVLEVRQLDYWR